MDKQERQSIAKALSDADESTLREIIREAESYLAAQLQAALAADLRAMTLAAVLAAVLAFLAGATATIVAAEKLSLGAHVFSVLALCFGLLNSLFAAVHAARPSAFGYAGNDPEYWIVDVEEKRTLISSLAGQAALYSRDIKENAKVLEENHRCIKTALKWVVITIILGAGTELVILFYNLAGGGFLKAVCG